MYLPSSMKRESPLLFPKLTHKDLRRSSIKRKKSSMLARKK